MSNVMFTEKEASEFLIGPDAYERGKLLREIDTLKRQIEEMNRATEVLVERRLVEETRGLLNKYEAALGIIQETVARHNLLVEAVGGEDEAEELIMVHTMKRGNNERDTD